MTNDAPSVHNVLHEQHVAPLHVHRQVHGQSHHAASAPPPQSPAPKSLRTVSASAGVCRCSVHGSTGTLWTVVIGIAAPTHGVVRITTADSPGASRSVVRRHAYHVHHMRARHLAHQVCHEHERCTTPNPQPDQCSARRPPKTYLWGWARTHRRLVRTPRWGCGRRSRWRWTRPAPARAWKWPPPCTAPCTGARCPCGWGGRLPPLWRWCGRGRPCAELSSAACRSAPYVSAVNGVSYLGFGKPPPPPADLGLPRLQQDWILKCLQGGRAIPLARLWGGDALRLCSWCHISPLKTKPLRPLQRTGRARTFALQWLVSASRSCRCEARGSQFGVDNIRRRRTRRRCEGGRHHGGFCESGSAYV
jgi:hypothetical protein